MSNVPSPIFSKASIADTSLSLPIKPPLLGGSNSLHCSTVTFILIQKNFVKTLNLWGLVDPYFTAHFVKLHCLALCGDWLVRIKFMGFN